MSITTPSNLNLFSFEEVETIYSDLVVRESSYTKRKQILPIFRTRSRRPRSDGVLASTSNYLAEFHHIVQVGSFLFEFRHVSMIQVDGIRLGSELLDLDPKQLYSRDIYL